MDQHTMKRSLKLAGIVAVLSGAAFVWYAQQTDIALWALDPRDGRVRWTRGIDADDADIKDVRIDANEGRIYVSTYREPERGSITTLAAYSAQSGAQQWATSVPKVRVRSKSRVGLANTPSMHFVGDRVVLEVRDDTDNAFTSRLIAFAANDGAISWQSPSMTVPLGSRFASHGDHIFVFNTSGASQTLQQLDGASGTQISEKPLETDVPYYQQLFAVLGVNSEYIAIYYGQKIAVTTLKTGEIRFAFPAASNNCMLLRDDSVIVNSDDVGLTAYDLKDGAARWHAVLNPASRTRLNIGNCIDTGEAFMVAEKDDDGIVNLVSVDPANGAVLRTLPVSSGWATGHQMTATRHGVVYQDWERVRYIATDAARVHDDGLVSRGHLVYDATTDTLFEVAYNIPRWRRWLSPWVSRK
jgi:outer membrane protein assembly factor BamB